VAKFTPVRETSSVCSEVGEAIMTKWWLSVALIASWLGQAALAPAQYIPSPVGAARMPDPTPLAPSISGKPQPPLVDGPITPMQAPPGPPSALSLPANHDGAFICEEPQADEAVYFSAGGLALMRQGLKSVPIATADTLSGRIETGLANFSGPEVENLNSLGHPYNFGITGTLGYFWNSMAVEASGFYIFESTKSLSAASGGQLNVPFINAPTAFAGDTGLWLQADRVTTTFRSTLGGAEINYRYSNRAFIDTELVMGFRYLDLRETLGIFTDDDGILNPNFADPTTLLTSQATYTVQTHNHMVLPQIGFEAARSLTPYFTFGLVGKAGLGPDFIDVSTNLQRGDSLVGFTSKRSDTNYLTQVYDLGAYMDFNVLQRAHIHVGYNAMWMIGVTTAQEELDFNLANPGGQHRHSDNIFYHGPVVQLEFLF
jgi:Putative beta barrel porin-7 (BBP7)